MDTSSAADPVLTSSPQVPSLERTGWVKYSETSNTVVVFVHGFMSSGRACWANNNGVFWPQLVADDPRFKDISVYTAEYFTAATSNEYGVADCASELYQALCVPQENSSRPPWTFANIVFVCHSLGGIVVRYLLCNHYSVISPKPIGMVLMASPSYGSAYADALSWVSQILGNKVGSQLKLGSEFLEDLDRRSKRLLQENKSIIGVEAVESKFYFGSRFLKRMVTWESAGRYFGEPQRIPNANHSLIVKPDSASHASHRMLLNFLTHEFSRVAEPYKTLVPLVGASQRAAVAKVLFDAFDHSCRDYYFRRPLDSRLAEALDLYAVWVYGPTGTGKTSSIRYYLSENQQKPIEISLSHLSGNLTPDACIREIFATCEQFDDGAYIGDATLPSICRALARRANFSPVVLYIDEIPISPLRPNELKIFVRLIADLLILMKQQVGSNCTIVLSSLEKPDFRDNAKLSEQMIPIEAPIWSDPELIGFYELIATKMADLAVPAAFVERLISQAGGSPRFLKTFLRNRYLTGVGTSDDIILAQTRAQYDWRVQ